MMAKTSSATSEVGHENKGERMTKANAQAAAYRAESIEREAQAPPAASGLRTERVVLLVTMSDQYAVANWAHIGKRIEELFFRYPGESVRVVEEPLSDAWAQRLNRLTDERDAAIRERDEAKSDAEKSAVLIKSQAANVAYFRRDRDETRLRAEAAELLNESQKDMMTHYVSRIEALNSAVKESQARVAELESQLESVADRAAAAETALEAAPAEIYFRLLGKDDVPLLGDEYEDDQGYWHRVEEANIASVCILRPTLRRRVPAAAVVESFNPAWVSLGRGIDATLAGTPSYAPMAVEGFPVLPVPDMGQSEAAPAASGATVAWEHDIPTPHGTGRGVVIIDPVEHPELWEEFTGMPVSNARPLVYQAAPAAPGWLTPEERKAVEYFCQFVDGHLVPAEWSVMSERLRALLARETPEVVRPAVNGAAAPAYVAIVEARDADWLAALAAAGVPWKEVE